MSHQSVRESKWTPVNITMAEADALNELGRRLASQREWLDEDETAPERSVIECKISTDAATKGTWFIYIREAVGVVIVGEVQIVVEPKIPQSHFFYLATQSDLIPRAEEQQTMVGRGDDLWQLVAQWFVRSTERLIRRELTRGYTEIVDELDVVRGQIRPIETATQCLLGRPVAQCLFEEFSEDIPLNRVIKEAAERVASSPLLNIETRRKAKGILSRMTDVGRMLASDLRIQTDRLTHRYKGPLAFAKTVIRSSGPRIQQGDVLAWSFLLRTPDVVESAIRKLLKHSLHGITTVEKTSLQLSGADTSLNPDLVFGGNVAVGDIKYKESGAKWQRSDLFQSVAFAAGFGTHRACVVGFVTADPATIPKTVRVGDIEVSYFAYQASSEVAPSTAAEVLGSQVRSWVLEGMRATSILNAEVA